MNGPSGGGLCDGDRPLAGPFVPPPPPSLRPGPSLPPSSPVAVATQTRNVLSFSPSLSPCSLQMKALRCAALRSVLFTL